MQINVNLSHWDRVSGELNSVQNSILKVSRELESVSSTLKGINNTALVTTANKISNYKMYIYYNSRSMKSMQDVFRDVGSKYRDTENGICGTKIQRAGEHVPRSGIVDLIKDTNSADSSQWLDLLLKDIKSLNKIVSLFGDYKDIEGIGIVSGLIGLLVSGTEGLSGEKKISELIDLYKSGSGVLGKLYHNNALNIISKTLGVIKEGESAIKPGDVWGTLLSMDKYISSGGELTYTVARASGIVEKGFSSKWGATTKIAPIAALFTMATSAVGNIATYSKDGCYDINDYGNTLLNTGVTGATSLIRGFTFGIVDIDTKGTVDIFNKNINDTAQWIKNTNWPTGVQVAAGIVATPGVAVVSAVHTVGDTFSRFGKNVENLWKGFFG